MSIKPYIEKAIFDIGLTSDIILKHTLKTKGVETEKEFFALDESQSKKRVILLIGMGKEGWDCKTLFATALISEVSGSNNYILQASTRCLRQIENNTQNATIYLSSKNREILDKELQANYGIDSRKVAKQQQNPLLEQKIIVKKPNIPTFEIKIKTRGIKEDKQKPFNLQLPTKESDKITKFTSNLQDNKIINAGKLENIEADSNISLLLASNRIATKYHLSSLTVLKELQKLYKDNEMPLFHLQELFSQIDETKKNYIETTDVITQVIAIIKTDQGFEKNDKGYYYHTLRYTKKPIFIKNDNNSQYGFHYEPYNFDSEPENDFFEKILHIINANADEIEDIYFTGGLTTPDKTDFHFEYLGTDKKYHKYYPDFLIRKKNGEMFIVEIKGQKTEEVEAKAKAVEQIARLNENKIKYCVIYTDSQSDKDYLKVVNFIKNDK